MTTTAAAASVENRPSPTPQAPALPAAAPNAKQRDIFRLVQLVLFTAGAILMPLGLIAIGIGWYGAAHTKYGYDQMPYLLSGGILGLGLVFVGGFLYFGAWLARVAVDQRDSARELADSVNALSLQLARQHAASGSGSDAAADIGAQLVIAGPRGTTVHRRDCALIMSRDDLQPVSGREAGLTACRVCKPTVI